MTEHLGFIVTDASPLITLGAANALTCLTMPGVPVYIPDMVYTEVTQDMARLGANEVVQWVRVHSDQVKIVPTQVYADYQALLALNPNTRSKGRGEQAAAEVLEYEISADEELQAVLLYEDNDIRRRRFVGALPDRVTALSTGDFLHELEAAIFSTTPLNVAATSRLNGGRSPMMRRGRCCAISCTNAATRQEWSAEGHADRLCAGFDG